MVRLVKEWDPLFFEKVGARRRSTPTTCPRRRSRSRARAATASPRQFDARLNGRWSRLRDASPDAEEIVAESVRSVFGLTRRRDVRRRGARPGDEPGAEPLSARHPERLVSLAADAGAAPRDLRVREAAESHRRLAGSAPPHGAGVAAADDVCRHRAARLHHAAADRRRTRARRPCTTRRCARRGRPRTGCWRSACRSSSRSTCCRTPRRCGSSSRDRCWRCCTSGRCAPASTRRRRSTWRRWTRSSRCGGAPAHRPAHRSAVRDPQRADLAALHRGNALLRRAGVARLPGACVRTRCRPRMTPCHRRLRLARSPLHRQRLRPRVPGRRAPSSSIDYPHRVLLAVAAGGRRRHRRRAGAARPRVASGCPGSTAPSSTTSSIT